LAETPSFALIWTYIDYGFSNIQLILFAWTTIERHILIFYSKCVLTKTKRSFVHYLPIMSILIYSLGYYLNIFFARTSMNTFVDSQLYNMNDDFILKNPIITK
jgi:hypothetical protein